MCIERIFININNIINFSILYEYSAFDIHYYILTLVF